MRPSVLLPTLIRGAAAGLLAGAFLAGCVRDEQPVSPTGDPETFRHLEAKTIRGSLRYHLNAFLPLPERYSAEILLVLTNTDRTKEFSGLTIPYANLYANTDILPLGTIPLRTGWDGILRALQSDTILLRNDSLRQGTIDVRCGQPVFFTIRLVANPRNSELITTDSLSYECLP